MRRNDNVTTSRTTATWLLALGLCGVTLAPLPARADDPVPSPSPMPVPAPSPVPVPTPSPSAAPDAPPTPTETSGAPLPAEAAQSGAEKEKQHQEAVDRNKQQQYRGNSLGRFFSGSLGGFLENVFVSGNASLSSRTNTVTGSASARSSFNDIANTQNFNSNRVGPFQQNMDLTISGRVLDAFTLDGRFSTTRQNSYFNQVFGINYRAKGTAFNLGDVSASLPGNEFVTFARTVRGLSFGRDFGNGVRIQGVGSYTQAVAKRGSFQGNGTVGPYPLQSSSIVEGSERVQKNGVDLVAGQDFQIDYLFGQIKFLSGQIINPEDTIVYTYEAQNFNSSPGLLTGLRFDLTPKQSPYAAGFTWLQQKQLAAGGGGVSEIIERFPVSPDATHQYLLASGIESGSVIEVRYLDQLLIENVDFQLVRASRFFRLLRKFPPDTAFNATVSLSIKYRPVRQTALGGDRSVMGMDGNFRVNPTTNLAWQYGRSQNTVTGANGGDAMSLNATFGGGGKTGVGGWNGSLGWRNVGDTYAGIDSISAAFLRAEKGLRGSLAYRPTSYLSFTSALNQSQIGNQMVNRATDGTESRSFQWNKNTQMQGGFSLSVPNYPRLDFAHSQIQQDVVGGTGSKSNYASDQLNLSYQIGILGVSSSLGHTQSQGQSVFASGFTNTLSGTQNTVTGGSVLNDIRNGTFATNSATDSSSDTGRLTVSLNPASWVSMTGALGVSRTQYGSSGTSGVAGSGSDARDNSFGLRLPLRDNLSFGMEWSDSTNGRSDTQTSTDSQLGFGIAAQRTRNTSFDARWQPRENLELAFQIGRNLSLIPGYNNTDSNNTAFSLTFAPVPQFTLSGIFSNSRLSYLGSQSGNSNDNTLQLQATAGPFPQAGSVLGRMTFSASWQNVRTGSLLSTNYGSFGGSDILGTTPGLGSAAPGVGGTTPGIGGLLRSVTRQVPTDTAISEQQQRLSLWRVRADYPVATRQSLYLQWEAIDSASPLSGDVAGSSYYTASNYQRSNGSVGYDLRLTDVVRLSANWNLISLNDWERKDLSYRARSLSLDLSAGF